MSKEMICKLGHTIPLDSPICDDRCSDYHLRRGKCINLIPYIPEQEYKCNAPWSPENCLDRDSCPVIPHKHYCQYAKPKKPVEPERQVSRDFDTIEHEAEMPLREQIRLIIQACKGYNNNDEEILLRIMQAIPAHDSAVAAKAVKEFAEKVNKILEMHRRVYVEQVSPEIKAKQTEYNMALDTCITTIRAMAGKE